jgi:hypothetical protein
LPVKSLKMKNKLYCFKSIYFYLPHLKQRFLLYHYINLLCRVTKTTQIPNKTKQLSLGYHLRTFKSF